MKKTTFAAMVFATLATGCASYANTTGSNSGATLTTAAGMTLYTFDKDGNNSSNCYDACAIKWPAYLTTNGAAPSAGASKSTRKDGSEQWAVDSQPLYTWVGDTKPGDTTGDGVGGVWHVAIAVVKKAKKSDSAY